MAITFPDPTGQPTDGSFTYTDPGNGQEYSWNGFGWDLVCSGGGGGGADVDHTHTLWHGDSLPTTTPEGDPVEEASLFFHTTILKLFIYTGGAWLEL